VILRLLKRLFATKLFGPRMLADPYPYYARLRSTAPVYWLDQVGAWVLTRYADVTAVLHRAQVSSDRANKAPQQGGPEYQALNEIRAFSMLDTDPPRHMRLPLLVNTDRIGMMPTTAVARSAGESRAAGPTSRADQGRSPSPGYSPEAGDSVASVWPPANIRGTRTTALGLHDLRPKERRSPSCESGGQS
jgi:hypothetical protein